MINPFADIHWNPDTAEKRKFARSLIIGFPIISAVLATAARIKTGAWAPGFLWLAGIGIAAGLIFLVLPQIAKPFYLVWYLCAASIGIVVSNLIFAAFYYLVITPVGILMRLFGRDPMRRKLNVDTSTYWRDVEKVVDPERYFRQF
jgi:hypothetical protein